MGVSKRDMQVYAIVALSVTGAPLITVNVGQQLQKSSLVISVVASGEPVFGGNVRLIDSSGKVAGKFITNPKGYAVLRTKRSSKDYQVPLDSGNYKIEVSKTGFSSSTTKVFLSEDDFIEKIIPLEPSNHRPIPDPGPTGYTNPKRSMWLDGSASHDPEADKTDKTKGIVEFGWELTERPGNSKINWDPVDQKKARFTPDVAGEYRFNLTVFDGELEQNKEHIVLAGTPYSAGAPIPMKIGGHKVTRIDDKMYLTGGWNETFSDRLLVYDLGSNRWTEGPAMQTPRNHHASVALGGRLYVMGGHNKEFPNGISTVEIYDPNTGRWSMGPSLPTPRYNLTATTWKGMIYALGGLGGARVLEVYEPETESWHRAPNLPIGRYRHAAQLVGDSLYIIGGKTTESMITAYDLTKKTWEQGPNMPTGRYYLDAVVLHKKIYVIGGHGISKFGGEPLVEVYDPLEKSWSAKNPLPFALDIHAAAAYQDRIFIFGGEREFGTSQTIDDTFVYDPRFDIRHTAPKPKRNPQIDPALLEAAGLEG